ncbi:hypothetical protein [Amycolatopsis circi]|uniref:hypothetical protein n=1 Tax=Amycolatopsis circi TaxID=871959 RepID=UPI000E260C62|nr:hypothetical protein [Amycolatopsis circi]
MIANLIFRTWPDDLPRASIAPTSVGLAAVAAGHSRGGVACLKLIGHPDQLKAIFAFGTVVLPEGGPDTTLSLDDHGVPTAVQDFAPLEKSQLV